MSGSGLKILPTLRPLQNGKWWVLAEGLPFEFDGRAYWVPAGFTTDFASTPRLLWWILPPYGRYGAAAIAHDYLYHLGVLSRADSDRAFLEIMESLGVLLGVRRAMWAAVRAFGWMAWSANAAERERYGCAEGCADRCCRVIYPVPKTFRHIEPRGLERLLHWLHGRFV